MNLEKSNFFQPEVKFLDHKESTNGIRMNPEKVDTVMKFRPPRNKKEVQTYLGFFNFYRKYIERFADDLAIDGTTEERPRVEVDGGA